MRYWYNSISPEVRQKNVKPTKKGKQFSQYAQIQLQGLRVELFVIKGSLQQRQ